MDDDLYDDLRHEFKLPPLQYIYGAMIIRLIALSYLFFALPFWQRLVAFITQLILAEVIAAYGWPFYQRPRRTS